MALSRTSALLAPVALGALLASPAPAAAPGAETFVGTCEMRGVIRHGTPLTNVPAPTSFRGGFRGRCSGELTDRRGRVRQVDGIRGRYEAKGAGLLSCPGGMATGTGRLVFAGGHVIKLRFTERRAPGTAVVTLEGAAGGVATVFGTVSQREDVAEIAERCGAQGVRRLRADARIVSPGISG